MTGSAPGNRISIVRSELKERPRCWLITGVAGFIGSHLLEELLRLGQTVRGLDNFITGHHANLDEVRSLVDPEAWAKFTFLEGDIRDHSTCREAVAGAHIVLHEAAIRSMVLSLRDPRITNDINITGFLNVLTAAKEQGIERFVYAGSSATYGDHPALPRSEDHIGRLLSPYAVTKYVNELYSDVFARHFDFPSVGLRYFNVFGPRQDPHGEYAPVISKWILAIMRGEQIEINGDGETTRDFCYIADIVQANLLAALPASDVNGQVFNVATGEGVSLNQAFRTLRAELAELGVAYKGEPRYRDFRPGDARQSYGDISKAVRLLGYAPMHDFKDGLRDTLSWYLSRPAASSSTKEKA